MSAAATEAARFLVVGVSNTLLSLAVFRIALLALPAQGGRAALAQALSYGAGILWSWVWNRRWTFRSHAPAARSLARFTAVQLALLASSAGLVGWAVDLRGWPATPAWIVVLALVTAVNFGLQRGYVFAEPASERNHASVVASPASSGVQPGSPAARSNRSAASALRRTSPSTGAPCSGTRSTPASAAMRANSPATEVSTPVPTL